MDIRFSAGTPAGRPQSSDARGRTITIRCTTDGTLPALFRTVSRDVPELAPILENATEQDDLEIFVNRSRLSADAAEKLRVQAGDEIELVVR